MHPAFALARKWLTETRAEFDTFLAADDARLVPMDKENSREAAWVRTTTRASGIEGVYTGMEGVLKEVLRVTDGGVFSEGSSYHAQLLAQASEATDDREGLLPGELYDQLNELRAFRHAERNNYRFRLKEGLVKANLALLKAAFPAFETQISRFLAEWEHKPDEDESTPSTKPK